MNIHDNVTHEVNNRPSFSQSFRVSVYTMNIHDNVTDDMNNKPS